MKQAFLGRWACLDGLRGGEVGTLSTGLRSGVTTGGVVSGVHSSGLSVPVEVASWSLSLASWCSGL